MNGFFLSVISLLLYTSSCVSQGNQPIKNQKQDTMKRFNEAQYKNLPVDEKTGSYRLSNGNLVQLIQKTQHHGYVEKINKYPTAYTAYYEYHLNDVLKKEGQLFYDFNTGKWKEYDTNGSFVRESDMDQPYQFSLDKLIDKIRKEYLVDLSLKTPGNSVRRFQYEKLNNRPFYEVKLASKENNMKINYILVDGNTGETLFKTSYFLKQRATPFDDYLKSQQANSIK